jgi:ribosomal protein L40E
VPCSKCAANLPDGSQFCLKCGQPVAPAEDRSTAPITNAVLGCSKCGASLPNEAQFCLKCGKPVSLAAKADNVVEVLPPALPKPRPRRRRVVVWLLLLLVFVTALWVITSDNPFAQGIQELAGWKHDEIILDASFSVGAHTFRYYKFSLPEGSVNVAMVGQFGSAGVFAGNHTASSRKDNAQEKDKDKEKDLDDNIEVYVLTESAFTVWQNGYSTGSVYESGRVSQGVVQADVPAGAGIYYLVFSNKFSPKTAKSVHATVLLRYKNWLPEWFRRTRDRFWNWVSL